MDRLCSANYEQISSIPVNFFFLQWLNKNWVTSSTVIHPFTAKTPLALSLSFSVQFWSKPDVNSFETKRKNREKESPLIN